MSAVLAAREPSARYWNPRQQTVAPLLAHVITPQCGVPRLRQLVLELAVRGRLSSPHPTDEPVESLVERIDTERRRLVADGRMKRKQELPAVAEEERPVDVPDHWMCLRLGALLSKIGAGSTPHGGREVYVDSGVKFLRSQNVWNDGLRLDGVAYITNSTHARMSGTVVRPNDLLFNITGASIGRCALVPDTFDEANVSQHVTIVRPLLKELGPYLHLVLISGPIQQAVMDVQVGVSREGLSIAKLERFVIPLPPLAEQARIVARVDELMRLCDALEEKGRLEAEQHARLLNTLLGTLTESATPEELAANWQRVAEHFDLLLDRPEAVTTLEQTILHLAVRGRLVEQDSSDAPPSTQIERLRQRSDQRLAPISENEAPFGLPSSWAWVRFEELIDPDRPISYGVLVPGPDVPNGVPLVRIADLSVTDPALLPEKRIGAAVDEQFARTRLKGGEILMGVVGSIGKLGVAPSTWAGANIARAVCRIVPADGVNREFVLLLLQSEFMQSNFAGDTRTLAQPTLNVGLIRSSPTPLPPAAEQARIVARVTELRRLCATLRERLQAQQATQSRLAEALVAELV